MNRERIDDLVDILGEEYATIENTLLIKNNQQLFKYINNPKEWKRKQLLHRNVFKRELTSSAKSMLKVLNDKAEKVYLLSYKEVAKDHIEITERELVVKDLTDSAKKDILKMKKFNAEQVARLTNVAYKTYTKQVKIIDQVQKANLYPQATEIDKLYDAIKRQTAKGIENGLKVVYRNQRQMTFKSYMEMNVRTTLHQSVGQQQEEVGALVNQIFYFCDSFSDSAPDHAPYQARYYYNERANIPKEVMDYIQTNNIESMQSIKGAPVYLTTRPNCRHNFHSVPTDEAMGVSAKKWGASNGYVFGKYEDSNYQKLQTQRYNERQIRTWKLRKDNVLASGISDPKEIAKIQSHITEYQRRNRLLVKQSDGVLKRDYERENAKVLVDNLGVKYDYKVVNGQLERK